MCALCPVVLIGLAANKAKKPMAIPLSSKGSLQRLLQSQKGQMPKLKVHSPLTKTS
jgi:hypothetical protein